MKSDQSQKSRAPSQASILSKAKRSAQSSSSQNMPRKQEETKETKQSYFNQYQKNMRRDRVSPDETRDKSETENFVSASFGLDPHSQTLQHAQLAGKIELEDPRSMRSVQPNQLSKYTAQTESQRTALANELANINRNQSNFSFASGSKLPSNQGYSKQASNFINTRSEGSAISNPDYSPSVAVHMGSISPTPNAFMFNESRMSGGKVGVSESSGDRLTMQSTNKQLTSVFANGLAPRRSPKPDSHGKGVQIQSPDHNAYMPVQMNQSAPKAHISLNSNQSNQKGGVANTQKRGSSGNVQEVARPFNWQNDAIAMRLKDRQSKALDANQDYSFKQRQANAAGRALSGQYDAQSQSGVALSNPKTFVGENHGSIGSHGSYASSLNQEHQFYLANSLKQGSTQHQFMNSSPDRMAFGSQYHVPMPMSPQEGELSSNRKSDENKTNTGRQEAYELEEQPYQQADFTSQLVAQIEQLQRYRLLCEHRISQLAPNHPLPVQEYHLIAGAEKSGSSQVSARDALSDQTDGTTLALRQHIDMLAYDKGQLERALREETLANEEQRNYIQILKNVIEQKLQRDGLLQLLQQASEARKKQSDYSTFGIGSENEPDNDPINLYVLLSDLKFTAEQKTRENQRLVDQLKSQEVATQKLQQENGAITVNLSNAQKQLAFYQDQNTFLTEQQTELVAKNEQLRTGFEAQAEQLEQLRRELLTAKNGGIDPDNTNNTLFQQILRANSQGRQSPFDDFTHTKAASMHSASTHQILRNQSPHDVSSVSQDVKVSLQNEIEALNKELISVQQTCMLSKEKILQFQDETDQQQQQLRMLQERIHLKDLDIRSLRDALEQANSEIYQREQQVDAVTFANAQLEKRLEMYTNKEKKKDLERSRQIEEAQINFMDESRKVEELSGHYDKTVKLIQKELKATRQSLRDLEIESEQRAHEVERLQAELELKSTQLDACKRTAAKDKAEIKELRIQIDEAKMEVSELTQDKARKTEKMQLDASSREQIMREKAELTLQVGELQHQLEVLKTQNQTTIVRSEQQVKEASVKAETLERIQKQRSTETDVLTKELTKTAVMLKQAEAQVMYLEKSNQQLMADLKQARLENDMVEREKTRQATQIADLVEENEQLYRNEERARRINEELQNARQQQKNCESEIEDLDRRLRNAHDAKEAQDLEICKLKREIQTLESDRVTLIKQKETLSCQTRDSERRIFEYVRQSQEADDKLRKNAILVKDMASERDKFKKLQEEKEQEIGDLAYELKVTRQKLTDLTLIEEKIVHFISDTDLQVEANKRTLHDYLRNLLRTIGASDSLCAKVNMRRRDKGYELQDKFAQRPKTSVEVWGQMVGFKDSQVVFGEAISYLTELIDIFLQTSVELNADFSKKERQVSQLESKLGSIHSVDYQAQESLGQLKQELAELRKKFIDTEHAKDQEIQALQETIKMVQTRNIELSKVQTMTEKKMKDHINDLPLKQRKHEDELNQTISLLQAEKKKLQELVVKLQSFLRGSPAEALVEQMAACALQLAKSIHDKATVSTELATLEQRLNLAAFEGPKKSIGSSPAMMETYNSLNMQISSPASESQNCRALRAAVHQKDATLAELDDRIAFLQGKYNLLETQLHEQRSGDIDIFPNRENPFRETESKTHSLQVLLKETKDLRQKLNERNSMITSMEAELRKMRTLQTMQLNDSVDQESPARHSDFDL